MYHDFLFKGRLLSEIPFSCHFVEGKILKYSFPNLLYFISDRQSKFTYEYNLHNLTREIIFEKLRKRLCVNTSTKDIHS